MANVLIETQDARYLAGTYNWWYIALIGVGVGIGVWVFGWLLGSYIIDPLLCRGSDIASCAKAPVVASNIAAIIATLLGIAALIRLHIRRPIVIGVAVLVAFWGFQALLGDTGWAAYAGWLAFLYGLGYVVLARITRFRNVLIMSVSAVVFVLLVRWIAFL